MKDIEIVAREDVAIALFLKSSGNDLIDEEDGTNTWEALGGYKQEYWFDLAQYAIAAFFAHLSASGLVIVPRIPTEEMVNAPELGFYFGGLHVDNRYEDAVHYVWKTMLSALSEGGE